MRVRIIKRKTIEDYVRGHARSRSSFRIWLTNLKFVDWNEPDDILATFGSADLLGNGSSRIVFNIGGNNYRMICKYLFGQTKVHLYIKWIGTHAEYDKVCGKGEQYTIDILLNDMETLKYKVIKSQRQYVKYCNLLEEMTESGNKSNELKDEIELLTFLVEKYDQEHNSFDDGDPIELLKSLMKDHKMKSVELARLLKVSTGLISDMLNYKKGLSKETIRILSKKFKLSQEAFNRPYKLKSVSNQSSSKSHRIERRKIIVLNS